MVHIEVNNENPLQTKLYDRRTRSDRDSIEKAEAAHAIRARVVTRRADDCEACSYLTRADTPRELDYATSRVPSSQWRGL